MIPKVYIAFISEAIEKTENNQINWEHSRENAFLLSSKNATIEITYLHDDDNEVSYYYFRFFNILKRTEAGFRVNSNEAEYNLMDRLYTVANASAANMNNELGSFWNDI